MAHKSSIKSQGSFPTNTINTQKSTSDCITCDLHSLSWILDTGDLHHVTGNWSCLTDGQFIMECHFACLLVKLL